MVMRMMLEIANTIEGLRKQVSADADKISVGNIVHIPYRKHDRSGAGVTDNVVCTTLASQGSAGNNYSSNRVGDRRIFARVYSTSGNQYLRYWYKTQIFGATQSNHEIFDYVNPTAEAEMYWSVRGGVGLSGASYYVTPTGFEITIIIDGLMHLPIITLVPISISGDTMNIQTPGSYTGSITSAGIFNCYCCW